MQLEFHHGLLVSRARNQSGTEQAASVFSRNPGCRTVATGPGRTRPDRPRHL